MNVLILVQAKSATNYKYGFGLEYDFTEHFGTRLEAERYRIDDAVGNRGEIDLVSLGVLYRFGANAAPAGAPVAVWHRPPQWIAPEHDRGAAAGGTAGTGAARGHRAGVRAAAFSI